jgi:hypothetical protein
MGLRPVQKDVVAFCEQEAKAQAAAGLGLGVVEGAPVGGDCTGTGKGKSKCGRGTSICSG